MELLETVKENVIYSLKYGLSSSAGALSVVMALMFFILKAAVCVIYISTLGQARSLETSHWWTPCPALGIISCYLWSKCLNYFEFFYSSLFLHSPYKRRVPAPCAAQIMPGSFMGDCTSFRGHFETAVMHEIKVMVLSKLTEGQHPTLMRFIFKWFICNTLSSCCVYTMWFT